MSMIIYDCEIQRAIPTPGQEPLFGVDYCDGWEDFAGMGIACICAVEMGEVPLVRVFCLDNLGDFQKLVDRSSKVVGFNNRSFDDRLCAAHGVTVPVDKSYDLQQAIWTAAGLGMDYSEATHAGLGLDALARANFGYGKQGDSAMVPHWWQAGQVGRVIDHCVRDVQMTLELLGQIIMYSLVKDPRDVSRLIKVYPGRVALYWNRRR